MKTPLPRSVRVILPLLCGVALLLLAAPARAQIVLVDNELTPASPVTSSAPAALVLKTNLTVSASANTLVVVVAFRNGDTTLTEAPATLLWTNATTTNTLTLAVQAVDKNSHGRGAAIYYLYNPPAGSGFNILGKLSGQGAGGSSGEMVAYTLGGVDTTVVPPLTGFVSNTAPTLPLSFNVSGVTADSWAAVGGATAIATALPITASNSAASTLTGTPVLTTTGVDFSSTSTASLGYISSMLFGGTETFYINESGPSDLSLVAAVFKPSNTTFLGINTQPQTVTIPSGQGLNATFTVSANGNPAVTSYQWYEIGGGVTNLIAGATTTSYTTNSPTVNGTGYFVVVGNGSSITSSVANLNIYTDGTWNTSSGSWNTPGNWVENATASGVDATASFVNDLGGTVTLDNTPGFTVGTNIFGVTGEVAPQTPWIINSGSPTGTLTIALDPTVPTSVVSGNAAPTVSGVPVITVYSNNPVTINAPLAGNQGLFVNGGGNLVLAGGNTNNTYSGPTVIGANTSDTTSLQIGSGGTSGAIDLINPIYLSGFAQLIFNRSDTITMSSYINAQAGKAPNVIVDSGTVIWAPQINSPSSWQGAIVNGGKLVLDCPAGVYAIHNSGGTVNITNGTPQTATIGNNSGGVSLGINSGGVVQLAGPGGNGVNIQNDGEGILDNGVFDLGGDAIQVGFIAGSGIVTNSGATLANLNLLGNANGLPFPWNGTIAGGTTVQTAVTLSGGTTIFTGPNTYAGSTILSGGTLILSNSASLASSNIIVSGGNLILASTPTITSPNAAIYVGSGRTMDLSAMTGNFSLNAGQTLVVTNTGAVNAGANAVIAASGSTLVPGGNGAAGTMNLNGNLTLNGNTNVFDLATTATEGSAVNDEIVGVTNLTLSGNITIKVNTGFNNIFNSATSYKLIKYSGTLANTATFTVVPATLGGNSVTIDTASLPGYVLLTTGGSSPPTLSVSATNIDAFTGYPLTLSPSEAGSTPITNQWFNGATAIPGAASASYTFTPLVPGVYTYTLYATNAFGHANVAITVNVGSPTISIQCTLDQPTHAYALYLAPTDTAGAYAVSNWNVFPIVPNVGRISTTFYGIGLTNPVDSDGFATPVIFTAVGVNDGYRELQTITSNDTANARMMNTYWYANPISTTPPTNVMALTFTNLPNDTYDVYVYLLQQVSSGHQGQVEVYDSDYTNYLTYGDSFTSTSNFVTGVNTIGTGVFPFANYAKLRISTGGSNSISFNESGTVNGAGGSGVTGIQIVPVPPSAISIVQQPVSQRVPTNLTAAFTVQASGFPLNYQWYSISVGGVTNLIADATDSTYTTLPVQDSDTGTGFFVVVSNSINQVQSSTAYLTVGRMVTASGLLIEDQFYYTEGYPYILIDMYPNSPANPTNLTLTAYLNTFESVGDLPVEPPPYHASAERIYGLFTPAVSGDYVFFITSDDAGALWLSTNSNPANSYLIAQNQSWMADRDWTCANTGSGEYVNYFSTGEFRSDLFISGAINNNEAPFNQYSTGWSASPNYNGSDGGIALVAGTPYYIELDNYYAGSDSQSAAVTYKLAGNPDPNSGDAPLLTSYNNNISAIVSDSVLPVPQPTITNITVSGSNVVLTGTNGLLNAVYYVLSTTNLATPPTNWTAGPLNVFDVNGNFINTNAAGAKETFYRLQVP